MPEAVAIAIAEAVTAAGLIDAGALIITPGATFGIGTGTAALAATLTPVVTVAAVVGLQMAISALLAPKASTPNSRTDITMRQALPPRFIDIGRVRTGGVLFFYESPDGNLYVGKILTCTKIHEIETIYLDDTISSLPGGISEQITLVNQSGPWVSLVAVEVGLGGEAQIVSPMLNAAFAAGLGWDSNHRNRGLPYVVGRYTEPANRNDMPIVYPNGAPNVTCVIKGARLPDVRVPAHDLSDETTWEWADCWARAVLRFLIDRDGWGLPPTAIHRASFAEAATDSDIEVVIPSGTEARYRAWGRYRSDVDRSSTLRSMLMAGDGRLIEQPDGTIGLFSGKYRNPAITITADDILTVDLQPFGDGFDRVANVQARVNLESNDWQETPAPLIQLAETDPLTNGKTQDLQLEWCPSVYQAQRLAKATLRRLNAAWHGTVTTNLVGLQTFGDPTVRVQLPELGIDHVFEIVSTAFNYGNFTVQLEISSIEPDNWSINLDDYGAPVTIPFDAVPPAAATLNVPTVSSGVVTLAGTAPASANLWRIAFYRATHGSAIFAQIGFVYPAPSAAYTFTDSPGTGTWDYKCRAQNFSTVESVVSTLRTITV